MSYFAALIVLRFVVRTAVGVLLATAAVHLVYMALALAGGVYWSNARYVEWLRGAFSGHPFCIPGRSEAYLIRDLSERAVQTLRVSTLAFLLALAIALERGKWRAYREHRISGRERSRARMIAESVSTLLVYAFASTPAFILAYLSLLLGQWQGKQWQAVIMLALSSGLGLEIEHLTRSHQAANLEKGYVETALAGGLPIRRPFRWRGTVTWHAFRNTLATLMPVATSRLPILVGGALVVEIVFNIGGLGDALLKAVTIPNVPMILAIVVILVFYVRVSVFLADLVSFLLRPRETGIGIHE